MASGSSSREVREKADIQELEIMEGPTSPREKKEEEEVVLEGDEALKDEENRVSPNVQEDERQMVTPVEPIENKLVELEEKPVHHIMSQATSEHFKETSLIHGTQTSEVFDETADDVNIDAHEAKVKQMSPKRLPPPPKNHKVRVREKKDFF